MNKNGQRQGCGVGVGIGVGGFGWSRSQSRNLKQQWSRSRKKMPNSEKNIKIYIKVHFSSAAKIRQLLLNGKLYTVINVIERRYRGLHPILIMKF